MFDCGQRASHVVSTDGAIRLLCEVAAPYHERLVVGGGRFKRRMLGTLTDDDDTVALVTADQLRQPVVHRWHHFLQKHTVTALRDVVGQVTQHLRKKRIGERLAGFVTQWDDHTHRLSALQAQVARGGIDDVAPLARQANDFLALLGGHEGAARQGARYSGGRDARETGNIRHLCRFGTTLLDHSQRLKLQCSASWPCPVKGNSRSKPAAR